MDHIASLRVLCVALANSFYVNNMLLMHGIYWQH